MDMCQLHIKIIITFFCLPYITFHHIQIQFSIPYLLVSHSISFLRSQLPSFDFIHSSPSARQSLEINGIIGNATNNKKVTLCALHSLASKQFLIEETHKKYLAQLKRIFLFFFLQ